VKGVYTSRPGPYAGDEEAKIKAPSKQMVVDWVGSALEKLRAKPDLIKKSFVVTGIATAMNGSDDHLVRCDDDDGGDANSDSDESFYGFDNEDRQSGIMSDLSDEDVEVSDVSDAD